MMEFHARQILPPKYWGEFEELCLDLFRCVWNDPLAQKNGRQGQPQAGTDISCSPSFDNNAIYGIQCKGKEARYGSSVALSELREEIDKAKTFRPPLKSWVFATTAPKDSKIEMEARLISEEHTKQGLFSVKVMGWEDLQSLIANYPSVMEKHFPDQAPTARRTLAVLEELQTAKPAINDSIRVLHDKVDALLARDTEKQAPIDAFDVALQARIDEARNLLRAGNALVAQNALAQIKKDYWDEASTRGKFRILTNLSAAHSQTGDLHASAKLALEAEQYAGNDPTGAANAIRATLTLDQIAEARSRAKAALVEYSSRAEFSELRIFTAFDEEGVNDPLALAPSEHKKTPGVLIAAAAWFRHRGQPEKSISLLEEAYVLAPEALRVQTDLGTSLLTSVFGESIPILGKRFTASERGALDRGIELLKNVWAQRASANAAQGQTSIPVNLISALRSLGRMQEATTIADDALVIYPTDGHLISHKAHLMMWNGQFDAAVDLLSKADPTIQEIQILRAEALDMAGRDAEALSVLDQVATTIDHPHREIARLERVSVLWKLNRQGDALAAADELVRSNPKDARPLIAISNLKRAQGDLVGAKQSVEEALKLISNENILDRLIVADAFYELRDWDNVASILASITSTDRDSQALRRLLRSLFEADRRQEAMALLAEIAPDVAAIPVYLRVGAMLHDRAGNLEKAREYYEEYLQQRPYDIETSLLWLEVVDSLGDKTAADQFLDGAIDLQKASPTIRIALAQVLDAHGRSDRAFELGYNTLRSNWDNPRVHLGFAGLMFMGKGADSAIPKVSVVTENTGITIADSEGQHAQYIIEPSAPRIIRLGEISPESRIGLRANGLGVNDKFLIDSGPISEEWKILEVKHKYLHLFHRSLEEFNTTFPEEKGLVRVTFDEAQPEKSLKKFGAFAQQRRSSVREIAKIYTESSVTLAQMASLTGDSAIDAWYGLQELDIAFDVCNGDEPERQAVLANLHANSKVVIDPLTFWIAAVLDIIPLLERLFGKLGITQSSIDLLQRCRDEREDNFKKGGGSVVASDNAHGVVLVPSTTEARLSSFQLSERILDHVRSSTIVLPAIPTKDFTADVRDWGRLMDVAFIDTIAAAQSSKRLLLAEDRRYRSVAQTLATVPGAWLQAALIHARRVRQIEESQYIKLAVDLSLAGHRLTSLDAEALLHVVKANNWVADDNFRRLAGTIGAPNIMTSSIVGIASQFLRKLWSAEIGVLTKISLSSALLDRLIPIDREDRLQALSEINFKGQPDKASCRELRARLRYGAAYKSFISTWRPSGVTSL